MDNGDFNPVVQLGTVEKVSGLRALRRRRDDLPPVEHGHTLVFAGSDGRVLASPFTSGERYWAIDGNWLSVDVSDHELLCRLPFTSIDGSAGYVIDVRVVVRVVDPAGAVRRRATSVAKYVLPVLRRTVQETVTDAGPARGDDTLSNLNLGRRQIESVLRGNLGPVRVDDWLSAEATDVSVAFDAATQAHHDALITQARTTEIDLRGLRGDKERAIASIEVRNTWAEHLTQQLSAPITRAVAAAAADPTPGNIALAVEQLNSNDQWTRGEVVSILNKLIDNNFVGDLSELQTIKVIVEGLQRTGTGDGVAQIETVPSDGRRVIQASPVATDHGPSPWAEPQDSSEDAPDDKDWS